MCTNCKPRPLPTIPLNRIVTSSVDSRTIALRPRPILVHCIWQHQTPRLHFVMTPLRRLPRWHVPFLTWRNPTCRAPRPPFCHLLVRRRPTHKLERTIPKRMIYFSSPGGLTVPQSRPHTHRFNIKTAAPSEGYHFVRRNTSWHWISDLQERDSSDSKYRRKWKREREEIFFAVTLWERHCLKICFGKKGSKKSLWEGTSKCLDI